MRSSSSHDTDSSGPPTLPHARVVGGAALDATPGAPPDAVPAAVAPRQGSRARATRVDTPQRTQPPTFSLSPLASRPVDRVDTGVDTAASSIIGGTWLGVDETDIETAQGVRVDGAVERELDAISLALDELGLSRCSADDAQLWSMEVVATGRSYAPVWLVNQVLVLITLGLYYPWARASRLQYLDGHTLLAGMPMEFIGGPSRLLRGMLALLLAGATVVGAGIGGGPQGWGMAAALGLLWLPGLLFARVRHRVRHSSWQGLRFGFSGGWAGAYAAAALPLTLGWSAVLLGAAWVRHRGQGMRTMVVDGTLGLPIDADAWLGAGAAVLAVLLLLTTPLACWMALRYVQSHLRLGPLVADWYVQPSQIYRVVLGPMLAWLAWLGLCGGAGWLLPASTRAIEHALPQRLPGAAQALAVAAWLIVLWLLAALPVGYTRVRLQNLVWNHTGNRYLRFRSALALGPYLRLQVRHHLLRLLTLGLYTPWATVASRRMRLEAVSVISRIVPDELIVSLHNPQSQLESRFADEMTGLRLGW